MPAHRITHIRQMSVFATAFDLKPILFPWTRFQKSRNSSLQELQVLVEWFGRYYFLSGRYHSFKEEAARDGLFKHSRFTCSGSESFQTLLCYAMLYCVILFYTMRFF